MTHTITAACILIINPINPNEVLGVARKDNHDVFGLPGGKVEDGETTMSAALREAKEETGLDLQNLELLFSRIDGNGVMCITYLAEIVPGSILNPRQGEAPVKWVTRDILMNGPFGDYNTSLFQKYDEMSKK